MPTARTTPPTSLARIAAAIVIALLCLVPRSANAQCAGGWLPGDGYPGIGGAVFCSTMWDPDGPGPLPARLVVGGDFTWVGNTFASNIAWQDPETGRWSPLGSGTVGPVDAVCGLANGELIAGGRFTLAGGIVNNHIARWNGATWSAVGAGVSAEVYALAMMPNGDLIAGGRFLRAGTTTVHGVARWDGMQWSALGAGFFGSVYSILPLPDGSIVAAGAFGVSGTAPVSNIAHWNGAVWESLRGGISGTYVAGLARLDNGDIIAVGEFVSAGGVPARHVARWDGTNWSALGSGLSEYASAFAVVPGSNGDILVGGYAGLARWDGTTWTYTLATGSINEYVYSLLQMPDGKLLLGGSFGQCSFRDVSGGYHYVPFNSLAYWSPSALGVLGSGMNSAINRLAVLPNGDVVAAGPFVLAGGRSTNFMAKRTGSTWSVDVGATVYSQNYWTYTVADVGVLSSGDLVVLGDFVIPGSHGYGLFRWNGAAWLPYPIAVPTGARVLAGAPGGDVIVAGSFTAIGATPVHNIARLSPTAVSGFGPGPAGAVSAVKVAPNGDVVVGGSFFPPGGGPSVGILRWDGTAWAPIGNEPAGTTTAIELLPGGGVVANFGPAIARWDGMNWTTLGLITDTYSAPVRSLVVRPNGDIMAGGWFNYIDGLRVNHLALWNGRFWMPLGSGTNSAVYDLKLLPSGDLAIAGEFWLANDAIASHFAQFSFADSTPSIVHQPLPALACPTAAAHFSLDAFGSDAFSYQWQVQSPAGVWSALSSQPQTFPCSAAAMASAAQARETDVRITPCSGLAPLATQRFRIRCIVSNTCSSLTSAETSYVVCPADFNCSGSLSAQDIFDFLNAWFALQPAADVNASGDLNVQDIMDYVAAWFAGCS